MTRKGFLALCVVTMAAVALAVFAVLQQPRPRSADVAGELLFPGLPQRASALKSVVVKGEDGVATLDWDGKTWTVRERKGYPADGEKISSALVQMARMVKLEAKTAASDRLERLQLNDPMTKGSHAKQISLLDRDGKVIADLIVGKRKMGISAKDGGTYVRLSGNPQSWLVLGELSVSSKPGDWLMRNILEIDEVDVKRVSVVHPDGEKVVVGKTARSELNFKIENLPAGKQQASAAAVNDIGSVVSNVVMDDVVKADDVTFPKDKTTTAEVETFSGMRVTLQLMEKDGKTWVRAKADAPTAAPPTEAKPGEPAPSRPPIDWAKIAGDINVRADGWAFQVPAYQLSPLQKRMADLIVKPAPKS